MRLLFCGDVVGSAGRRVVLEAMPTLRKKLALDFVIVNGENAAHGFGLSDRICRAFLNTGVDVVTSGNHVWDQREIMNTIDDQPRLLRPINYPEGTPGRGEGVFDAPSGQRVLVINAMGRLFMDPLDDPFAAVERTLARHRLKQTVDCVVIDIHAEATSEKMAMGHFVDGRASLVVGTHSHVPTADCQILPGGTAYQSDVGMCGDYDSVIGMKKETAVARFVKKVPGSRLEPAEGEPTLCAVFVETDDRTGLARHVAPLRFGGRLAPHWPVAVGPGVSA